MTEAEEVNIGVLLIGSLYWDAAEHRKTWRYKHLKQDAKQYVRVPIRYGRRSKLRGCSYTMVFSAGLREADFGTAIVIPCKSQDIVEEAKCLWAAESKKGSECGVSASWGCVGLLPNPDSTRLPSKQLGRWRDFVKECAERRSNYRALAAADAGIDKEGVLKIRWPMLDAGSTLPFDALLATATEPTMHDSGCPSPHDIAAAWKTTKGKQEVCYFWKNRKHRIWTFQDDEISSHLPDSDHAC